MPPGGGRVTLTLFPRVGSSSPLCGGATLRRPSVPLRIRPGEEITVRVIQEGKEQAQGVGYLEDGTMVVIENGARHIGTELAVTVMRVLQTVGGRMIFAQPKGETSEARRPRAIDR